MSMQSAMSAGAGQPASEVTLFGLLGALYRRKGWIIIPTLLATLAAVAYVLVTPPRYMATTTVLIEQQETPFTRPQAADTRERIDREAVTSQVQVIRSVDVARMVADKLDLDELPEFNPALRPRGLLQSLRALLGQGGNDSNTEKAVIRAYFERLEVLPVRDSRVVEISFWSRDDELSAAAANAVAEAYLEIQRRNAVQSTAEASSWLEGQIADLRAKVADAERNVELFRAENGLFTAASPAADGVGGRTLAAQELSELSSQLTQARAQRSDAQARARLIRELLESGRTIEARDVFDSALIQRLQEERVRLGAQIAELSSTLLPAHPRMKELNAQRANLDRQLRAEAEKLVRGLENDAAVAAAREQQIQKSMEALKTTVALANENEVQLRALEREAKAQRDLLATYLTRYREAVGRTDNAIAPLTARIISHATVPLKAFFPSKKQIPLVAMIATFAISGAIVLTLELAGAYAGAPVPVPAGTAAAGQGTLARREPVLDDAPEPASQEPASQEPESPAPAPQEAAPPPPQPVPDEQAATDKAPVADEEPAPEQTPAGDAKAADDTPAETARQVPKPARPAEQSVPAQPQPAAKPGTGGGAIAAAMRRVIRADVESPDGSSSAAEAKPAPGPAPKQQRTAAEAFDAAMEKAGPQDAQTSQEAAPPAAKKVVAQASRPKPKKATPDAPASKPEPAKAAPAAEKDDLESLFSWRPETSGTGAIVTAARVDTSLFESAFVLGRLLAGRGQKVILIEATPGSRLVERVVGAKDSPGFFDLLNGTAGFDEVMFGDPDSRLHLIGSGPDADPETVSRDAVMTIAGAMVEAYDTAIFVAPAMYTREESRHLAELVDEVMVLQPEDGTDPASTQLVAAFDMVSSGKARLVNTTSPEQNELAAE